MRLSVEVVDHIFSFLLSHRESLIACSKVPRLSPIVERHLYYHVTVHIVDSKPLSRSAFEPEHLSKVLSENPHILNYVRILQIEPDFSFPRKKYRQSILRRLDEFSKTLLMFPGLECIMLTSKNRVWYWSDAFRVALEDRLNLPTMREIHFVASKDFPFSLLHICKHVKNLSLSGSFKAKGRICDSTTLPQLKSLTLRTDDISSSLLAWLKLHINELQSLKCAFFSVEVLLELLRVCSETLNKLDVDLTNWGGKVQPSSNRGMATLKCSRL